MITCGTDIIEIYRIKEAIEDMDDKFIKRIIANLRKTRNINIIVRDLQQRKRSLKRYLKRLMISLAFLGVI